VTEGVYEPRLGSDWDTRLRLEVYRLLERALGEERRARWAKAIRENIAQLAPDAKDRPDIPGITRRSNEREIAFALEAN